VHPHVAKVPTPKSWHLLAPMQSLQSTVPEIGCMPLLASFWHLSLRLQSFGPAHLLATPQSLLSASSASLGGASFASSDWARLARAVHPHVAKVPTPKSWHLLAPMQSLQSTVPEIGCMPLLASFWHLSLRLQSFGPAHLLATPQSLLSASSASLDCTSFSVSFAACSFECAMTRPVCSSSTRMACSSTPSWHSPSKQSGSNSPCGSSTLPTATDAERRSINLERFGITATVLHVKGFGERVSDKHERF